MLKLYDNGIYLVNGETICSCPEEVAQKTGRTVDAKEAEKGTMAYGILQAHNKSGDPDQLQLKFDSMTSHDITYVGIIQTARASGMKQFPLPYVLTNCHNSLCAVGGTINEDDHKFALSAAHKYGGIYVPTNMANIHSYNRETMAGGGKMILGSDSHTRYGALGTMAVGEGGGELVKQLLCDTCRDTLPRCERVRYGADFGRCAASLYYEGAVRQAILDFKFKGKLGAMDCFGRMMAETAAEVYSGEFDAVTWVPVSKKRLRKRGFDQARFLTGSMCVDWHVMPLETLRKVRDNLPQSGIDDPAERRVNVLDTYEAVSPEQFAGKRLLLVDDICTTGATLGECACVLKAAGAADVMCLTLAMVRE